MTALELVESLWRMPTDLDVDVCGYGKLILHDAALHLLGRYAEACKVSAVSAVAAWQAHEDAQARRVAA
jgi:hypothetical protein